MDFPQGNKIHREPLPSAISSNAKLLEEKLRHVDWKSFGRSYLFVLSYVLLTIFSLIVVVGLAKAFVSLFS